MEAMLNIHNRIAVSVNPAEREGTRRVSTKQTLRSDNDVIGEDWALPSSDDALGHKIATSVTTTWNGTIIFQNRASATRPEVSDLQL